MKLVALTLLVAGSAALAQQRPNPTGFGSVLYPGTGGPPPARAQPPNNRTGFGSVLYPGTGGPPGSRPAGGFIRGVPQVAHPHHGRTVVIPYPVFYGDFGYDTPPQTYAPAAGYENDAGYAPASQPPVVIINKNFRPDTVNPVMRDYSETPLPESTMRRYDQPGVNDDQPTVFLIALKDHTIFPAVAYWVEGDTLNYITTQGSLNRASLELVDREFSKQLNDERHIEFRLPAAK